jgi:hypothetical protein
VRKSGGLSFGHDFAQSADPRRENEGLAVRETQFEKTPLFRGLPKFGYVTPHWTLFHFLRTFSCHPATISALPQLSYS